MLLSEISIQSQVRPSISPIRREQENARFNANDKLSSSQTSNALNKVSAVQMSRSLTPYPLYQHAIVPFEFPLQVGWLFPLFTFNNVPLRGRYTFALSSARFSAYYLRLNPHRRHAPARLSLQGKQPSPSAFPMALLQCYGTLLLVLADSTYLLF